MSIELERRKNMARKRLTAEQIVTKLRQIEVLQAQGKTIAVACKESGTTEQKLRDECLNGEIFYSLREAQMVIEMWRFHYNSKRPHSSLGYRPPAPVAITPKLTPLDEASNMQ
jgi:transposase InsO family protein